MAVINSPWVGVGRGKLGQAVYYRSKGNTVARSYNPEPQNRRTVAQQVQRSQFATAVKFFSRGVQNLFQFAFENKRPNESDYNAFMRYNAKRGIYFGPQQNASETYPAWGEWILSRGSLSTPRQAIIDDSKVVMQVPTLTVPPAQFDTLGELSEFLVSVGYLQGDIFTFLAIDTGDLPGSEGQPFLEESLAIEWIIRQFVVDTSSTQSLADLGIYVTPTSNLVTISTDAFCQDGNAGGGAVIFSRISNGKLLVCNSVFMMNELGQMALGYGRSDTWLDLVLEAWDVEQASILQGSVAKAVQQSDAVAVFTSFPVPAVGEQMESGVITITGSRSVADIIANFKVYMAQVPGSLSYDSGNEAITIAFGSGIYFLMRVSVVGGDTVCVVTDISSSAQSQEFSGFTWG